MTKEFDETLEVPKKENKKTTLKITRKASSKPTKKIILETSILECVPKKNTNRTVSNEKLESETIALLSDVKQTVTPPQSSIMITQNKISASNISSIFKKFSYEEASYMNLGKEIFTENPIINNLTIQNKVTESNNFLENINTNDFVASAKNNILEVPSINENVIETPKDLAVPIQNVYTNITISQENINEEKTEIKKYIKQDKNEMELKKSIEDLTQTVSSLSDKISNLESSIKSSDNELKTDTSIICDNKTLLIDEDAGKVYLPYSFDEIMQKLIYNPSYYILEDVIEEEYTLPLYIFKNSIRARFKEAYRLMRIKEYSSITEALNLARKVMFNSSLNPAIIRACKNKQELNYYLDCLYKNQTEKFETFKVIYKSLPTIK